MTILPLLASFFSGCGLPLLRSVDSIRLTGVCDSKPKLTFDAAGKFKVVSFSDMHMGEGEEVDWGPQQDVNTSRVHATVLDEEKPSYVVFNGDLITGEATESRLVASIDVLQERTSSRRTRQSISISSLLQQSNVTSRFRQRTGIILMQHDNAEHINHQEEIEYEQAHYGKTLSYTRSDVGPKPYGLGNYWVPVYAKPKDVIPAAVMWFFDSRSFVPGVPGGSSPGTVPDDANFYWVDDATVPPYIECQMTLMRRVWGTIPPALVFVHIPVQKAQSLATLPSEGDHDDEPDPSSQGFLNGTYTGRDLPFWNALIALNGGSSGGNVLAVTSGHDHGESWCARSNTSSGIPICFNGHSGYGGYTTAHSQIRNGRVFELDLVDLKRPVPIVRTWNSYEDKTIGEQVVLGPDYMKEYN
ncbi:Metallo-dependent phosphatase-like protein [Mycena kentingensis (nom. inval.)]|nr:Metallo-dependent phosphatase-like protein [Mycena kentingensis (nom. inval.)]